MKLWMIFEIKWIFANEISEAISQTVLDLGTEFDEDELLMLELEGLVEGA
jgi:hypothetical protein